MLWEADKVEVVQVGNNEEEEAALVEEELEEDEDTDDVAKIAVPDKEAGERNSGGGSAHDNHISF